MDMPQEPSVVRPRRFLVDLIRKARVTSPPQWLKDAVDEWFDITMLLCIMGFMALAVVVVTILTVVFMYALLTGQLR